MSICYQCNIPIQGFDYGYGYNSQCGGCKNKELDYLKEKENKKLENTKLKLEIKELKNKKTR